MIEDISALSKQDLHSDVLIIGAGPAGLTLARELQASDLSITIVDAGAKVVARAVESGLQMAHDGYTYDLDASRGRGFGGSSGLWNLEAGWRVRHIDPEDFTDRGWIPESGWPISHTDLSAYYSKAQELLKLGEDTFDPEFWMKTTGKKSAIHSKSSSIEVSMMKHGNRKIFCEWYSEFQSYKNINVVLNANVIKLNVNTEKTSVTSLDIVTQDGKKVELSGKRVVLCCGGIDNAKLLMQSDISNNDNIGRYFMEHLHSSTGIVKLPKTRSKEDFSFFDYHTPENSDSNAANLTAIAGIIKLNREAAWRENVGSCILFLHPSDAIVCKPGYQALHNLRRLKKLGIRAPVSDRIRLYLNLFRDFPAILSYKLGKKIGFGHSSAALRVTIESEQSPNPDSRVLLDEENLDKFGVPAAKLQWRVSDIDISTIRKTQEVFDSYLRENNLGHMEGLLGSTMPYPQLGGGSHHMGTTRMGVQPETSVVDKDLKMHGIENLYIAGSSVFPTGGSCNPTFTIIALSLRLADKLLREFSSEAL